MKHFERVLTSAKSSIILMFAASFSGRLLPPFLVYKAEHVYDLWVIDGAPGTKIFVFKKPKYAIRENRSVYKMFMWLVIRAFNKSDIGTYNCVSTNSLGRAEGTLRLYVPPVTNPAYLQTSLVRLSSLVTEIKMYSGAAHGSADYNIAIVGGECRFCHLSIQGPDKQGEIRGVFIQPFGSQFGSGGPVPCLVIGTGLLQGAVGTEIWAEYHMVTSQAARTAPPVGLKTDRWGRGERSDEQTCRTPRQGRPCSPTGRSYEGKPHPHRR
ncbi:hypothetical protein PR048_015540 [Dryococelus australis]|uniref:Ig-like domain-containing protein n=1 Tax=Dryococelus australis TaxID=614101 RepID=A0ABQ9HHR8_9NEOP|nr:hypothetical protein PR048_015540 [Dryococelus australis]